MTTTDTRAALDAAIDANTAAAIADAGALGAPETWKAAVAAAGALDRAIAAHVEAEVARRLAVAPEVEEAIVAARAAAFDMGMINGSETWQAMEQTRDRADCTGADLRAAIAADKARAVEAAHEGMRRVYADRMLVRDREAMEALAALDEERSSRPTPDEARRLVEDLDTAAFEWGAVARSDLRVQHDAVAAARAALLRALGVEA